MHTLRVWNRCWALLWTETGAKKPEDRLSREERTAHARSSIDIIEQRVSQGICGVLAGARAGGGGADEGPIVTYIPQGF